MPRTRTSVPPVASPAEVSRKTTAAAVARAAELNQQLTIARTNLADLHDRLDRVDATVSTHDLTAAAAEIDRLDRLAAAAAAEVQQSRAAEINDDLRLAEHVHQSVADALEMDVEQVFLSPSPIPPTEPPRPDLPFHAALVQTRPAESDPEFGILSGSLGVTVWRRRGWRETDGQAVVRAINGADTAVSPSWTLVDRRVGDFVVDQLDVPVPRLHLPRPHIDPALVEGTARTLGANAAQGIVENYGKVPNQVVFLGEPPRYRFRASSAGAPTVTSTVAGGSERTTTVAIPVKLVGPGWAGETAVRQYLAAVLDAVHRGLGRCTVAELMDETVEERAYAATLRLSFISSDII